LLLQLPAWTDSILINQKFLHYKPQKASSAPFVQDWVRAIAEDSSHHLWIGTVNGISILDRNTGTYTTYQWNHNDPYSLSDNSVRSMCLDKMGNFWVGTAKGLNLFDPIQKRFRVFILKKIIIPSQATLSIILFVVEMVIC
jgi:ligand-binding sensor domain-containing protein